MRYWLNHRFWSAIVLAGALIMPTTHLAAQAPTPQKTVAPHAKPVSKLSSRLQMLAQSPQLRVANAQTQARALSLPPSGAGSLLKNAQGQLLVYLYTDDLSQANLDAIQNAGATIVHVSAEYHVVTVYVGTANLNALAGISAITGMREELQPMVQGNGIASLAQTQHTNAPATCNPVISYGDTQLNASAARAAYGVDGTGIKVGVLSDSYNALGGANTDVSNGELPGAANPCGHTTAVAVISDTIIAGGGADEGRAMAQIVHDLAPGAQLGFASAFNGIYGFADNIRNLRTWGANIIVDDVYYLDEPLFQDGPVAVAISDVVGSGAMYFTSAGNSNHIISNQNVGSYEAAAYRPTTCPANVVSITDGDCHNFSQSGTSNIDAVTIASGGAIDIDLQWNEPWGGIQTDLDLYLLNSTGTVVISSTYNSYSVAEPIEYLYYQNTSGSAQTYQIVVNRYAGTETPRIKFFFTQRASGLNSVQFSTTSGNDIVGPSLSGHSASKYALSVAALPYSSTITPETFSSRGPAAHYFGPVLGTTPASAIVTETLQQPDFTATDGGCNSFFGSISNSCHRFYGTSAAAPHAAAVAALALQEAGRLNITYTQSSMRTLLKTTASSMSGGDINSSGAGMINALAAVSAVVPHRTFLPVARK
jgi:hypothetical protein